MASASSSRTTERVHEERRFTAPPGGSLVLDLAFHTVAVEIREGDDIEVEVAVEVTTDPEQARQLAADYAPTFEEEEDRITVVSSRSSGGRLRGEVTLRGVAKVQMPPGVSLDVSTTSGRCVVNGDVGDASIRCSTSSGGFQLRGGAQDLHVEASSGPVTLVLGRIIPSVRVDTSSGRVKVSGPIAVLQVNTSSGDAALDQLVGHLIADTSSGNVSARWIKPPRGLKIKVDTGSGNATLTFPAGSQLTGRVSTGSGGIRSDFSGTRSADGDELLLHADEGGALLAVDTGSGNARLVRS